MLSGRYKEVEGFHLKFIENQRKEGNTQNHRNDHNVVKLYQAKKLHDCARMTRMYLNYKLKTSWNRVKNKTEVS